MMPDHMQDAVDHLLIALGCLVFAKAPSPTIESVRSSIAAVYADRPDLDPLRSTPSILPAFSWAVGVCPNCHRHHTGNEACPGLTPQSFGYSPNAL